MLILLIITLFGASLASSLINTNNSIPLLRNDCEDNSPLLLKSLSSSKFKRELKEFNVNTNLINNADIFSTNKIHSLSYNNNNKNNNNNNNNNNNIKVFSPRSLKKIKRSNSENLSMLDQNSKPSVFPFTNYGSNIMPSKNNVESNQFNENFDAWSQFDHTNNAYSNIITPTSFDNFVANPEYIVTKFGTYSDIEYKPLMQLQYNSYPVLTEVSSGIPTYDSISQIPAQSALTTNYYLNKQPALQYVPYMTQLMQEVSNVEPISKVYVPVNQQKQHQQHQPKIEFQNIGQNTYLNIPYTPILTDETKNSKLKLPLLQLPTNHQYPSFMRVQLTPPVIFSTETGLRYETDPNLEESFNFNRSKNINMNQRLGTDTPFATLLHNYDSGPTEILPIQTSDSTAQFPKFKGARIGQISNGEFSSIPHNYQDFKSQTQLHFDGNLNNQPKNHHTYINSLGRIGKNVKTINKKKPNKPLSTDDHHVDDRSGHKSDDGYESTENIFPNTEASDIKRISQRKCKLSPREGNFKPSEYISSKEYDPKFIKEKKNPVNIKDGNDKNDNSDVNLSVKYRYLSRSNDKVDDDNDN